MTPRQYARHFAMTGRVAAPAHDVFALVDDHARLSAHMSQRSWTSRWLGALFGGGCARWCTARMVNDTARHFAAEKRSAGNAS